MSRKALCIICSETTDVLKEHNTARYCNLKHKEKYKGCVDALGTEKVAALERGLELLQ
jgi:hypothetical protein